MASDLDEELLAAAGCTGKGKSRPSKRRIKKDFQDSEESAREEEEEEEEEEEDDDDSDAPIRKSEAMASRRQQGEFSEDEDDDEDDEQEDSLSELSFGESLYGDEEDRARLDAMSMVQREMIFLERGEKLQQHKHRQMQKARKREEKKGRTRASVTPPSTRRAGMASTPRSRALRGRTAKMEKTEILNNLVALKQSKSRDSALKKRRLEAPPSDEEDERSASRSPNQIPTLEEEEAVESGHVSPDDRRVVDIQKERKREELTFQDISEITIRRTKLVKWFSEPYFEDVVIGCFVRLAVGEDSATGYHLCQVTGIEVGDPSRMYKLENRTTHKYLSCAFGDKVFTTSMSRVSEQPPMQEEFDEWRGVVEEDLSMYKDLMADKAAAISKVGTFVYSADTVKRMIEEKKKSAGRPFNLAAEKDRVARELALAEHEHPSDIAKIEQLQAQLRQLEALGAQRRVKDAKAIALAEMNRRNREENFRNASQRKVLEAGQDGYDPFSRRWTRSQNYYSKAPAPQPKVEPVVVPIASVADQVAQKEAAEAGKLVNTAPPSNQLVQLHRFELPLDLSRLQKFGSGPAAAALAYLGKRQRIESIYGPPVEVHNLHTHPQTLSINDYKRRMNLID